MTDYIKVKNLELARGGQLPGADPWEAAAAAELLAEWIKDGDTLEATFSADQDGIKAAFVKSPRTGFDCVLYPSFFEIVVSIY